MVSGLKNCDSPSVPDAKVTYIYVWGNKCNYLWINHWKEIWCCGYSWGLNSERSAVSRGQSEWLISFLLQLVSVDLLSNKASQQGHTASGPTKNETENTAKKWNAYTHRADSHLHIMGSVMDRGGLEIISNILYVSGETVPSCCIFASLAPVSHYLSLLSVHSLHSLFSFSIHLTLTLVPAWKTRSYQLNPHKSNDTDLKI